MCYFVLWPAFTFILSLKVKDSHNVNDGDGLHGCSYDGMTPTNVKCGIHLTWKYDNIMQIAISWQVLPPGPLE